MKMLTVEELERNMRRLPARVLHARGEDSWPAEEKQRFAEEVWYLSMKEVLDLIWEGAAENPAIMDALQTELEIDPELETPDILQILAEMQPDLLDRAEVRLAEIYEQLLIAENSDTK